MSEQETWFAIEVSLIGENDWNAHSNTTYDSAAAARKALNKKGATWNPDRWEFRVVRKDLTTTVEPEKVRAPRTYKCFKCGERGNSKPYALCAACLHASLNRSAV